MMNPSNYPPGVTGCEPQITGEDYCDRCALFDEAIAALRLTAAAGKAVADREHLERQAYASACAVLRKVDHPNPNEKKS